VDTLRQLRDGFPPDTEVYFIVGSDVLDQFHRWKEPEAILELCRLAVIERPGGPEDGVAALRERFPHVIDFGAVVSVAGPRVDFSASDLRRVLAAGESTRYQIPDAVATYIAEHELYRAVD
jgi:nicotinate-nucleotide adenylyltransferase